MNRTITLATFPFYIPISTKAIENFIVEKIKELSIKTGMPGDKLPIHFFNTPQENDKRIAYFTYNNKGSYIEPESFTFNLYKFNDISNISSSQISDIVTHEFAHYLRRMFYGPSSGDGHDEKFREVCRDLGCSPDPIHKEHLTIVFK